MPNYPTYCYIENDRTMGLTDLTKPTTMYGHPGVMIKDWKLENVMLGIIKRTTHVISEKAKESETKPFFIYIALTAPHTPIALAHRIKGTSKAGIYGDYIQGWTVR